MPSFTVVVLLVAIVAPLLVSHFTGGWVAVYTSKGFTAEHIPRLDGQVAVVTGANTGIGKITVRDLAQKGARVVLTSRSVSKGNAARQEVCELIGQQEDERCPVTVMALDLASLESVLDFSSQLLDQFDRIDMLILNAGIMFGEYATTAEGFERQWGTNHLGHFFLVERLLPLLMTSRARVVSVSSSAHNMPYSHGIEFDQLESDKNYNQFQAYGQSKLSNILFARELSDRFSSSGLSSNSLHPGVIQTELMRHANNDITSLLPTALADFVLYVENLSYNLLFMNPDQGALTQLYVATSPDMAGVTGKFFKPVGMEVAPSALGRDVSLQRRLWEVSARFTRRFLESKGLARTELPASAGSWD
eukprot:CAMPEP_0114429044 /NCGR_PEP_ID=MMETSP0103-20121206/9263_1 /TAXON_ID=37642 ORGANISM="Paraphysomonas imperforata, Strain PA2" /NCGR_SAMPLE_ID=MMETSP0103 /ASSEMBLY_ACC=CAM_ASM_000201 /LENGTH=361 /DNA_ID=CAMNT_0001598329 /DNA_START=104 /DNA_END=1189 /DNA_ORIENTATION=+